MEGMLGGKTATQSVSCLYLTNRSTALSLACPSLGTIDLGWLSPGGNTHSRGSGTIKARVGAEDVFGIQWRYTCSKWDQGASVTTG